MYPVLWIETTSIKRMSAQNYLYLQTLLAAFLRMHLPVAPTPVFRVSAFQNKCWSKMWLRECVTACSRSHDSQRTFFVCFLVRFFFGLDFFFVSFEGFFYHWVSNMFQLALMLGHQWSIEASSNTYILFCLLHCWFPESRLTWTMAVSPDYSKSNTRTYEWYKVVSY